MLSSVILSFAAFPLLAAAHGTVTSITIDGKSYKGPPPNFGTPGNNPDSVIRQVQDVGPTTFNSKDLVCGQGATKPAADVAQGVKPGANVQIKWQSNGGTNWIHDIGPVLTYMAKCDGSCANFDASKARWFKIQESGLKNGKWAMADVANGKSVSVTIPDNLASGDYLFRSELIALHNAVSEGGAELFASCAQLKVTGNGNGSPREEDLVKFPGAYKASDKGLLVDVYNLGKSTYSPPGPKIASFVSGGSSGGSSTDNDEDSSAPEDAKPTIQTKTNKVNAAAPTAPAVNEPSAPAAQSTSSDSGKKTCTKRNRRAVRADDSPVVQASSNDTVFTPKREARSISRVFAHHRRLSH